VREKTVKNTVGCGIAPGDVNKGTKQQIRPTHLDRDSRQKSPKNQKINKKEGNLLVRSGNDPHLHLDPVFTRQKLKKQEDGHQVQITKLFVASFHKLSSQYSTHHT
jgi:hypothetical protein